MANVNLNLGLFFISDTMDDIIRYHIIGIVPECFLSTAKWTRNVALDKILKRRFTDTTREFWDTLTVIARCHRLQDNQAAKSFIHSNDALLTAKYDIRPSNDTMILQTYTVDECNYIVKRLLAIPYECGVADIRKVHMYFVMTFSIYYAHNITVERSSADVDNLLIACMRHFPEIIPRYLLCMTTVYSGVWPDHQLLMLRAMAIIEQYYSMSHQTLRDNVFAVLRRRINENAHIHTTR
nr:Hypothetical protein FSTVLC9_388 [Faustovirus]